ncbi:MAG: cytidine deaminase [Polyangiales bacterium]
MTIHWEDLRSRAATVRKNAHAPYSKFHVGAALLAQDGRVFEGANVENASYGLCLCAERSAVAQAVAAGATAFEAIAIVAPGDRPVPPCGMCRQVLAEFSPAMTVRSYTEGGAMLESSVAELLPHGFSSDFLE